MWLSQCDLRWPRKECLALHNFYFQRRFSWYDILFLGEVIGNVLSTNICSMTCFASTLKFYVQVLPRSRINARHTQRQQYYYTQQICCCALVWPQKYWKYWLISSSWSQQILCEVDLPPTFEATQKQNDEMRYDCLAQSLWGHRIKHCHALYCNARHCSPLAKTHKREHLNRHHVAKSPPTTFSQLQEDLFGCMHDHSSIYTF